MRVLFLVFLLLPFDFAAAQKSTKPNIILVMADDQGWGDMGSIGHSHLVTPHFDKAAAEGGLCHDRKEGQDVLSRDPDRAKKMRAELEKWLKSVARSLNGEDY